MAVASIARGLLDLIAPLRCPACDTCLAPGGRGFCPACGPLLEPVTGEDRAVYLYGGPLADAIVRMKYGGRPDLAPRLGALLAPRANELGCFPDAVVPVPLHPRRLRERGFNQAALLARPLARALGRPLRTSWLRRIRDTAPQASLDASRRPANVRAAFVAKAIPVARVLLVDDVRTTGATLAEAAVALRAAGAQRVDTLCLARVDG